MLQEIGYNVRWKLFGQKSFEDRDWGDFASDIRTNENKEMSFNIMKNKSM